MKEPKPASFVDLSFLGLNLFVTLFSGCFEFPRANMYCKLLLKCTLTAESIDSMCNKEFESSDRLLFYMKKSSVEHVKGFSCMVFKSAFKKLKACYDMSRGVRVAIDTHHVPYYGEEDDYVFYTVKRKGSRVRKVKVLKYATLSMVSRKFKYTIAALPLKRGEHLEEAVDVLLGMAAGMVRINMVIMDKEFYNQHVLTVVEKHGLSYLVPVKWCLELDMLYWLSRLRGKWVWPYMMNSKVINPETGKKSISVHKLVTVYIRELALGDYHVYTTNRNVKGQTAESLSRVYELRWNIENSYKDAENYVIKTSSKNHAYRFLLFMLSHLMMNLQELAKKATRTHIRGKEMLMIFELLIEIEEGERPRERIRLTKRLVVQF
jgi:hypothetical protein